MPTERSAEVSDSHFFAISICVCLGWIFFIFIVPRYAHFDIISIYAITTYGFILYLFGIHKDCESYGVLDDIEAVLKKHNLHAESTHSRKQSVVPLTLIYAWASCFLFCGSIDLVALGLVLLQEKKFIDFASQLFIWSVGGYSALCVSLSIWVFVDRKRYWYLSEEGFRRFVDKKNLPQWHALQLYEELREVNVIRS